MEEVMQERRQHLSRTCASQRQGESDQKRYEAGDKRLSQSLKKESFLVDHKRRLIYCWNHKVLLAIASDFTFLVLGCLQFLDVALHKAGNRERSRSGERPARPSIRNTFVIIEL